MLANSEDMAISRAVTGLGRTVGLLVVADEAERIEDLNVLRSIGCDEVQEYLISCSFPAHEFSAWLSSFC